MLSNEELRLAVRYAPILLLDEKEPFLPVRIGMTILRSAGESPSFRRSFAFEDERLEAVLEYAIFWDYDITHLYDLEHVWIYAAKDGSVLDCEASSHGKFLKGLRPDRSNLEGERVRLYCQPGKHAFATDVEGFEPLANASRLTLEHAGKDGLIVTGPFHGAYETSETIHDEVRAYMQRYRFEPSWRFRRHALENDLFTSWDSLRREVPARIACCLGDIRKALREEGIR